MGWKTRKRGKTGKNRSSSLASGDFLFFLPNVVVLRSEKM
jgi:hypothetical protein